MFAYESRFYSNNEPDSFNRNTAKSPLIVSSILERSVDAAFRIIRRFRTRGIGLESSENTLLCTSLENSRLEYGCSPKH